MPYLLVLLGSFLAKVVGPILARVLAALGLSVVTYQGVDLAISALKSQIQNYFGQIPADILNFIGLSGVDVFISLVFSAYAASFALNRIGDGLKKVM